VAHGASGDCGGGNDAASGGWGHGCVRCFFFFLSLLCFFLSFSPPPFSLLCSVFFCFFSFGLPPLFCSLVLPLLLSLSFCSLFPCFYRQKTGERETGWPLCCHPSIAPPTRGKLSASGGSLVSVFLMLFRGKKSVKTGGRKIFFFPFFARPGEEEDPQCCSKRQCFGLFFF